MQPMGWKKSSFSTRASPPGCVIAAANQFTAVKPPKRSGRGYTADPNRSAPCACPSLPISSSLIFIHKEKKPPAITEGYPLTANRYNMGGGGTRTHDLTDVNRAL